MNQEEFIQVLESKGITLSDKQIKQFELYYQTLIEWNEKLLLSDSELEIPSPVCIAFE